MTVLKNKAECVILSASHPSPSSGRTRGTVISIDAITTSNDDDDDFRTKTFFEINLLKMIDILGRWNYFLTHYNILTDYFMYLEWA